MPTRVRIDPAAPDPALLRLVAHTLSAGEIVAYPTDTLYGLAADPRQAGAIRRLYEVKARSPVMALPLVAADLQQVAATLGQLGAEEQRLAAAYWPGPLTLVMATAARLAPGVARADGTVAVRVPDHAVARGIARALGHPITATSANLAGQPAFADAAGVAAAIGVSLALVVDGGPTPGGPPSTIVRVVAGRPTLVREGAVPFARVLELFR
jgi:L-threonylcarbamoyladenylate synthase